MVYHRFLASPTTLLLCSIGGSGEIFISRIKSRWLQISSASWMTIATFILSFASYPVTLISHPLTDPDILHWHKIAEAQWHRQHEQLAPSPQRPQQDRRLLASYAKIVAKHKPQTRVLVEGWCRQGFFSPASYVINTFGLTDSILAHVDVGFLRPGHKLTEPTANSLGTIMRIGQKREPGMFRRLVETGQPPDWVAKNLPALELIERKIYNHHRWMENIQLAFKVVGRIPL